MGRFFGQFITSHCADPHVNSLTERTGPSFEKWQPTLCRPYDQSVPFHFRLAEWIAGSAVALALMAPRGLFIYLSIMTLVLSWLALVQADCTERRCMVRSLMHTVRRPTMLVLWMIVAYASLSAFWSLKPEAALNKAAQLFFLLIIFALGQTAILRSRAEPLWLLARGSIHGAAVGLGYLAIEHGTGGQLKAFVANTMELTPREMTFHVVENGQVVGVLRAFLNRHSAALCILMFPLGACLAAWLWPSLRRTRLAILLHISMCALLVMVSESETAKLAYIISLGVFAISWISSRGAAFVLGVSWCTACLAMPLLVMLAFPIEFGWQRSLPPTAYDRVEIWRYTVKQIPDAPIFGVGANQTRYIFASRSERDARMQLERRPKPHDGFHPVPRLSVHAHNFFIQTWFELGALGAMLLTALGLSVIRAGRDLPPEIVPFAFATFGGAATVAASGYGIWQMWLIAAMLTAGMILLLASRSVLLSNTVGYAHPAVK